MGRTSAQTKRRPKDGSKAVTARPKGGGKTLTGGTTVLKPKAKPKPKPKPKAKPRAKLRSREGLTFLERMEGGVWGLGIVLLGLLVLFSLVSFRSEDIASADGVANVIGPVGAWLSYIVLYLTGFCGYLMALGAIYLGGQLIAQRVVEFKTHQVAGFAVILVPTMVILHFLLPDQSLFPKGGGGVIGLVLGTVLEGLIYKTGTVIVATGGIVAGLSLMFRIQVKSFFTVPAGLAASLVRRSLGADEEEADATGVTGAPQRRGRWKAPVKRPETDMSLPSEETTARARPGVDPEAATRSLKPVKEPEDISTPSASEGPAGDPEVTKVAKKEADAAPEPGAEAEAEPDLPDDAPAGEVEGDGKEGLLPVAPVKRKKRARRDYEIPDVGLLEYRAPVTRRMDDTALQDVARTLVGKLEDFKVDGDVEGIHPGPVITLFEFKPGRGIKISQVEGLSKDLAMGLAAEQVRIIAPIPGKDVVGVEVPNKTREVVYLKELFSNSKYKDGNQQLPLALGKDIAGYPLFADLTKMPHLLVAGTTGSGKSVLLHAFIMSILFKLTPDQVRFVLVDTKMLELTAYAEIPHLLLPVVTEAKDAAAALRWAVGEMERRNRLMSQAGVPNVAEYNQLVRNRKEMPGMRATIRKARTGADGARVEETVSTGEDPEEMPYIVVIIDELADLMMVAGKQVEASVARLAQMARAAGIHMIIATQNPTIKVVTGIIKANMPSRISLKVRSMQDSRVVLDQNGADDLLGWGDMLFLPPGSSKLQRIHGAFVSTEERHEVVRCLRAQGAPEYDLHLLQTAREATLDEEDVISSKDDLYEQAKAIAQMKGKISTSALQRDLGIGYNKAAVLMSRMEKDGLVGPPEAAGKPRMVLF